MAQQALPGSAAPLVVGLILLDEHGNMLFMNRAAQLAETISVPVKSLIDDALNSQLASDRTATTHRRWHYR
ncbi:MAG: hypothetical protein U1F68_08970 [Gammaproteobacteria bacterium]